MVLGARRFQLEMQTSAPSIAGDVLAPGEVGDVDLDGGLEGIDADLAVAAEGDGADVAGGDAVGLDDIDDGGGRAGRRCRGRACGRSWRSRSRRWGMCSGRRKTPAALGCAVTADAFEDGGAVVDDVAHDVDLGFFPGDE